MVWSVKSTREDFPWGARTFKLRLPQRRRVAGNDDELSLARTETLEGRLVAQSNLAGLSFGQLAFAYMLCDEHTP